MQHPCKYQEKSSVCLRDKDGNGFGGRQCKFLNAVLRTLDCFLWVMEVLKQGGPCAGRLGQGETGGASSLLLESVVWSSALFRTFILDLKALLSSPTISHNSI